MNTINPDDSLLLFIDFQEKLVKIPNGLEALKNAVKTAKAANILKLPAVITEQYPKGLGSTSSALKEQLAAADYVEKTSFSAYEEIKHLLNKKQIIISGIETHICVLQTAFDLLNSGYEVFIVKCACASRNVYEKEAALERLSAAGVQIITVEMLLFELLKTSKHPDFKAAQAIIK